MKNSDDYNLYVRKRKLRKKVVGSVVIGVAALSIYAAGTLHGKSTSEHVAAEPVKSRYERDPEHEVWAKRLQEGSLIVHIRHAQREKWNDVTAFDALELAKGLSAEHESFSRATCLTEQGVEEAKMIGQVFEMTGVEFSSIYTSPSCRARQTSEEAFGNVGTIVNSLLHRTAIMDEQHEVFAHDLREAMMNAEIVPGKNVVFSGHGGTLGRDGSLVIDVSEVENIDDRQEGGFVVIERVDGKLIARHKFESFHDYSNATVSLKLNKTIPVAN